jgi:ubiquinone/menaquinone biosynthesis C-methylase UbiE
MENEVILKKEEAFHDEWAESINIDEVMVDEFFESCTSPENRIILSQLGDLNNKHILEVGCGAGEASVYFAKKGAVVTATDISSGMLNVVNLVAQKHFVKLTTVQCFADSLPFDENSFDVVYAANILHHVNVFDTINEIKRVLKKGGVFVCWEPLAHNPAINIYRRIATEVRTSDEHPLKMKDIKKIKKSFLQVTAKGTWLFTLLIFVKYYFINKIDPNKERYWKKILTDHEELAPLYCKLEKVDNFFLKLFPFLKRYCWNIVLICKK